MRSSPAETESERFAPRFSLRSLLISTFVVAGFCGILSIAWNSGANKAMFWYLAATGYLAIVATLMMSRDIVTGAISRKRAIALLVSALLFAAANIGLFCIVMAIDPFIIFSLWYIIPVCFLAPPVGAAVVAVLSLRFHRLDGLGVFGFFIFAGCVGFVHLWVIAQCSASV